jgi:hypothetical protein
MRLAAQAIDSPLSLGKRLREREKTVVSLAHQGKTKKLFQKSPLFRRIDQLPYLILHQFQQIALYLRGRAMGTDR